MSRTNQKTFTKLASRKRNQQSIVFAALSKPMTVKEHSYERSY